MNPITVRIFDVNHVKTCFLDMCPTTSSTAEVIFTTMNSRLGKWFGMKNPRITCTAADVDNTSVNIGGVQFSQGVHTIQHRKVQSSSQP